MKKEIKVIAFDADDTLWINEPYFQEAEKQFCALLGNYLPQEEISKELFQTEMKNLSLYGYGAKGFLLCMIETANRVSENKVSSNVISEIIEMGQDLLQKPIELLKGVPETLENLKDDFQLIVATKGDLLDQERKLKNSGIEHYFHHIEIMSEKKTADYQKLLSHLNCLPENFLMLGNSVKSDILPILELGANAGHIPYHVTWTHEQQEQTIKNERFVQLKSIDEILNYLPQWN
ncbi:MAG: HAD family hydrolase [Chitinophagales bacterium]|nr:HAD family hydrolase [Chitinophagales bacterium]MCZ2394210.1 HAD family hydrolase [Chitinophagales bacterium]